MGFCEVHPVLPWNELLSSDVLRTAKRIYRTTPTDLERVSPSEALHRALLPRLVEAAALPCRMR